MDSQTRTSVGDTLPPAVPPPWMQVTCTHQTFTDEPGSHTIIRGTAKRGQHSHAYAPATVEVLTTDGRTQVAVSAGYMDLDAIPWLVGVLQHLSESGEVRA